MPLMRGVRAVMIGDEQECKEEGVGAWRRGGVQTIDRRAGNLSANKLVAARDQARRGEVRRGTVASITIEAVEMLEVQWKWERQQLEGDQTN